MATRCSDGHYILDGFKKRNVIEFKEKGRKLYPEQFNIVSVWNLWSQKQQKPNCWEAADRWCTMCYERWLGRTPEWRGHGTSGGRQRHDCSQSPKTKDKWGWHRVGPVSLAHLEYHYWQRGSMEQGATAIWEGNKSCLYIFWHLYKIERSASSNTVQKACRQTVIH